MHPHSKPLYTKGLLNNIALPCFFALLAIAGFYLSLWQYHRGLSKELLITQRQHQISFELSEPLFLFSIEQGNREKHFYAQGKIASGAVMVEKSLAESGKKEGYWHPIEKNIFQSQTILNSDDGLCASYSLWACAHAKGLGITGVIKDRAWEPSMTPQRHYAYAVQWAGLGGVAFIMALISLRLLILRFTNVFFDTCGTT